MKQKLDEQLCKDFPLLFKDRTGNMQNTVMCWGFECSDGWEPLIREASEKLEPLIEQYIKDNPEDEHPPTSSQVKEKYGTLRWYMAFSTEDMDKIISEAEDKSETTCEICGKSGKLRGKGWYYTACSEHTKDNDK